VIIDDHELKPPLGLDMFCLSTVRRAASVLVLQRLCAGLSFRKTGLGVLGQLHWEKIICYVSCSSLRIDVRATHYRYLMSLKEAMTTKDGERIERPYLSFSCTQSMLIHEIELLWI
jgi:hypothetical protein